MREDTDRSTNLESFLTEVLGFTQAASTPKNATKEGTIKYYS